MPLVHITPNQYQFLCLVGSQDVVLAEILHGLDNSVDIDEDSVLGSQVPQEIGNKAAHGSEEDMQDLSHPLDGAVNWDTSDDFQRGNLNRYVVNTEKKVKWQAIYALHVVYICMHSGLQGPPWRFPF
jgi:hypothetical protein